MKARLDRLMARAYRIRNLCVLVLAGIVIACFVLSWYVTNSISDPVRRLITVMQKTGSGKWTARYENSGHDEITILGDCFNEMAENTLDIIRWEAMYEANGESRVTQMIEKFSQLCRMGMRTGGNTIPLGEGIEHASTYMEVINFRHRDKIGPILETQVDADSVYIPQFMLQPILENAVVHAFGDASSGYFIRIRLFYGDAYGISVDSTAGEGPQIEILLPLRDHSESMIASDCAKTLET